MITIIYPCRNREPERVKKSLDSLTKQSSQNFKVIFADYGSDLKSAAKIKELVSGYAFVTYIYNCCEFQPWSRAKAINFGLRHVTANYVFTADVDMIFSPGFVMKLHELKSPVKAYYFKVGFLSNGETGFDKDFEDYIINFTSGVGAQGLSLFPTKEIIAVNGYDEFLHFWGAEDVDIHNRLERIGIKSIFYKSDILMLHQWHKSYRISETNRLTKELQLTNIVKINHQHLVQNDRYTKTIVNNSSWGNGVSLTDYKQLDDIKIDFELLNKVEVIMHFLFWELPALKNGNISIRITKDIFQDSLRYKIKKIVGKTVPQYYSLKEINDMFLLHIISFYHTYPYSYKISTDLKSITFKIKK